MLASVVVMDAHPGAVLWAWLDALAAAHGGYAALALVMGFNAGQAARLRQHRVPVHTTLGQLLRYAKLDPEQAHRVRMDASRARAGARRRRAPDC